MKALFKDLSFPGAPLQFRMLIWILIGLLLLVYGVAILVVAHQEGPFGAFTAALSPPLAILLANTALRRR